MKGRKARRKAKQDEWDVKQTVTDLIKGEDHHSKSPSVMHFQNGKTMGVAPEVDKREIEDVF